MKTLCRGGLHRDEGYFSAGQSACRPPVVLRNFTLLEMHFKVNKHKRHFKSLFIFSSMYSICVHFLEFTQKQIYRVRYKCGPRPKSSHKKRAAFLTAARPGQKLGATAAAGQPIYRGKAAAAHRGITHHCIDTSPHPHTPTTAEARPRPRQRPRQYRQQNRKESGRRCERPDSGMNTGRAEAAQLTLARRVAR